MDLKGQAARAAAFQRPGALESELGGTGQAWVTMDISANQSSISQTTTGRYVVYTAILLLVITASLFVYKSSAALGVIEKVQSTRTFQPRLNVLPIPGSSLNLGLFARTLNYFAVIWPALLFGILISGAVRVLDPPRWLMHSVGRGGARAQLAAGLA